MVVGTLKARIHFHMSHSLKMKRSEINRVKTRIKQKGVPVVVAEVGENEKWQLCELGFACVSNDEDIAQSILDSVEDIIESKGDAELLESEQELLHL